MAQQQFCDDGMKCSASANRSLNFKVTSVVPYSFKMKKVRG